MAWTSGTASNMVGLLQDLETFLATNGWTVLRSETFQNGGGVIPQLNNYDIGDEYSSTGDSGVDEYRIVMQGPGYAGAAPPVFGIETRRFAAYNYNYLVLASSVGSGAAGTPVYQMPGVSDSERAIALFSLWDAPMNYWFTEDGGAVCAVVQVSNIFFHFYIGHYVPLATPGEIPQPAIYTGNIDAPAVRPYTNSNLACFGTYRSTPFERVGFIWTGGNVPIEPGSYNSVSAEFFYESDKQFFQPGVTDTGDYLLYPITLISKEFGCFGTLSLLYKAPLTAVAPGSTVDVDGTTYVITNNAYTDDAYNRFAVRLG